MTGMLCTRAVVLFDLVMPDQAATIHPRDYSEMAWHRMDHNQDHKGSKEALLA